MNGGGPEGIEIRPLGSQAERDLVAERMRLTLLEVVGEELYTMDWLRDRVDFHLREGAVLVAAENDETLGHTIVRVEDGVGLFSTTYVDPAHRRRKVAQALVRRGEEWLAARGMAEAVTCTAESNLPLQRLFQGLGYAETDRREDFVKLSRSLI